MKLVVRTARAAAAVCLWAILAASCVKQSAAAPLKVGAAATEPHAEILKLVAEDLKKEGVTLEIHIMPDAPLNEALEAGDLDANYFQHIPFLEQFNKEHGFHLTSAGGIHIEPIALYSAKITNIGQLQNEALIAIPDDPANKTRALMLLEAAELIQLKRGAGQETARANIAANPRQFRFREVEASELPETLADAEAAVINGNYALSAGMSAKRDGIVVEDASSPYVNVVAVKQGREDDPQIKALVKALQSQAVKEFILQKYPGGEVIPAF